MIQKVKKSNGINLPSIYSIPDQILRKGGTVGQPIVYLKNGEEAFVCRVLCAWENERTILLENLERLEDCFYAVDVDDVDLYPTFMQAAAALNNKQEKPKIPSYISENKEFGINLISSKCKGQGLESPFPDWIKDKSEAGRLYLVLSNYPTPCPCAIMSGLIDDKVVLKPLVNDFCQRIDTDGYANYIVASEEEFGVKFFYDIASAQTAFLNNLSQKSKEPTTDDTKEPTDMTPERKPGYHYEQEKESIYTPAGMILLQEFIIWFVIFCHSDFLIPILKKKSDMDLHGIC